MKLNRFNIKGETIMETVIAMAILAAGIAMAGTIMATSLRNINASKNRVIAVNIAREGLEAMRNIRDTNWLKYGSMKRACWNFNPDNGSCDGTDTTKLIQSGDYIIYKKNLGTNKWEWNLKLLAKTPTTAPTNPTNEQIYYDSNQQKTYIFKNNEWHDLTELQLVDIDPTIDTDNNQNLTDDSDAYNHTWTPNPLGTYSKFSSFKRWLELSYLGNNGTVITGDNAPNNNRLRIHSIVTWQEGDTQFKTDLYSELTDYQGRENLSN